jgi:hypothetical protein
MAGKGPQLRKGANLDAYWNNYDSIFRRKPQPNSDGTCNHACPFFNISGKPDDLAARCSYKNEDLIYYDGFNAICTDDINISNEN